MKFDPYQILLRPQISEKALRLAGKEGKYTFRVARQANKVGGRLRSSSRSRSSA